jgi:hypothetical protein
VHGAPSSTLQGACENGVGLICRCRALAVPATVIAAMAMRRQKTMRRGMRRTFEGSTNRVIPDKMMRRPAGIKAGLVHIPAFIAASSAMSAISLGWSSAP